MINIHFYFVIQSGAKNLGYINVYPRFFASLPEILFFDGILYNDTFTFVVSLLT